MCYSLSDRNLRLSPTKEPSSLRAMADAGPPPPKTDRPLGPDGKPIPGPEEMRQIQAARKMAKQHEQVEEVIGIMHKNVENV